MLIFIVAVFSSIRRGAHLGGRHSHDSLKPNIQSPSSQNASFQVANSAANISGAANSVGTIQNPLPIESVFRSLLERNKQAAVALSRLHDSDWTSFGWLKASGYIEARLLAICHPREVQALVSGIITDPTAHFANQVLAIRLLGVLAANGGKEAESQLMAIAQGSKHRLVPTALAELFSYDTKGSFQFLYSDRCAAGILEAFDQGPYCQDIASTQVFERCLSGIPGKSGEENANLRQLAQDALKRMAILESSERSVLLEGIVKGPYGEPKSELVDPFLQEWALRVIERNPTASSLVVLRDRLHRGEERARTNPRIGPTDDSYLGASGDPLFDRVLLTYQKLGGNLTDAEKERLTYYGYLGEPAARLAGLFDEHQ